MRDIENFMNRRILVHDMYKHPMVVRIDSIDAVLTDNENQEHCVLCMGNCFINVTETMEAVLHYIRKRTERSDD